MLYSLPKLQFTEKKGLLHDVGHIDITIQKYSISYFFVVMSQILGRQKKTPAEIGLFNLKVVL